MPTYLALGGYFDDVAGAQGGIGVGDEVALVGLELLFVGGFGVSGGLIDGIGLGVTGGRGGAGKGGKGLLGLGNGERVRKRVPHLFEKFVVGLFGGADFDGLHHFAGGDDDAADDFGRHGGVI